MNSREVNIGIGAVVVVAVVLVVIFALAVLVHNVWKSTNRVAQPAQNNQNLAVLATPEVQVPAPTPTAIPQAVPSIVPSSGWRFEGFTNKVTKMHGYKYHWATFTNDNGLKLIAMCSSPNSPAPKQGAEYRWNKKINILIPIKNNKDGTIQKFWYPTIQK